MILLCTATTTQVLQNDESSHLHNVYILGNSPRLTFYIQWNLIITVALGPSLAGYYIKVAILLSDIQNHHN